MADSKTCSRLQQKYNTPQYKNITAVKYLLKCCGNYNLTDQSIKATQQIADQIEVSKTTDINMLLEILEKEHVIDTDSKNTIKRLYTLNEKNTEPIQFLISCCTICFVPANDPEIRDKVNINGSVPYRDKFDCEKLRSYAHTNRELHNILGKYDPLCGQSNYDLIISIFLGFILFEPKIVTVKLLRDRIATDVRILESIKQTINRHIQEADKFIKIANEILAIGLDKYVDMIRDDMFALMDYATKSWCQNIIQVIQSIEGGMDWLKKDGKADSESPTYKQIQEYFPMGWEFFTALCNVRTAYQHSTSFLHKAIIANSGLMWDSFSLEEALAIGNGELVAYVRGKLNAMPLNS